MRVNEQTYAEIMLAVRQNGGTIGPPALVPGLLPVARGGSPSLVASFNTHRGNAKAKQAVDSLRAELDYRRVVAGLPEFRFHAVRRWRFDLAWPWIRVAFELQGGGFTSGRHTRGSGLAKDCEKFSAAAADNWLVLMATHQQAKSAEFVDLLIRTIELRSAERKKLGLF